MNEIEKFILEHEKDCISKGAQEVSVINNICDALDFKSGIMLKTYLLNYGFLSFSSVELLGVGVKVTSRLSAIRETKILREKFGLPHGFIVIENIGDGLCIVCDESDRIFEFNYNQLPKEINLNLNEYILKRFIESSEISTK